MLLDGGRNFPLRVNQIWLRELIGRAIWPAASVHRGQQRRHDAFVRRSLVNVSENWLDGFWFVAVLGGKASNLGAVNEHLPH